MRDAMRDLPIDPTDSIPIWKQIEDGVRRLVASGEMEPGSAVPSVREMAKSLRINPATVARAYGRLTDAGILAVRRGEGTFVAPTPPAMRPAERNRELDVAAARFTAVASSLGATLEGSLASVERVWGRKKLRSVGGKR